MSEISSRTGLLNCQKSKWLTDCVNVIQCELKWPISFDSSYCLWNLKVKHFWGHFQELWEHNTIYLYTIQGTVWSPCGMNEGDVVPFGPACKHLFLRDEAVVVSSSTAFVLGVSHTLIRTPGLVVVVGNLLSSCMISGKIKCFTAL